MTDALRQLRMERCLLNSQPLLQAQHHLPPDQSLTLEGGSRRDLNLLLDFSHRLLVSRLMLEACLFRQESRGGHFRTDAPAPLPQWQCHTRQSRTEGIRTRPVRS